MKRRVVQLKVMGSNGVQMLKQSVKNTVRYPRGDAKVQEQEVRGV